MRSPLSPGLNRVDFVAASPPASSEESQGTTATGAAHLGNRSIRNVAMAEKAVERFRASSLSRKFSANTSVPPIYATGLTAIVLRGDGPNQAGQEEQEVAIKVVDKEKLDQHAAPGCSGFCFFSLLKIEGLRLEPERSRCRRQRQR